MIQPHQILTRILEGKHCLHFLDVDLKVKNLNFLLKALAYDFVPFGTFTLNNYVTSPVQLSHLVAQAIEKLLEQEH